MPVTARQASPPPRLSSWNSPSTRSTMFYPPHLSSLLNRQNPLPCPSTLPASRRFKNQSPPPFGTCRFDNLQQEIDTLEHLEDDHDLRNSEIKEFGYSWLIPLGRQNTHEEEDSDDLSQTSTSPRNATTGGGVGGTTGTTTTTTTNMIQNQRGGGIGGMDFLPPPPELIGELPTPIDQTRGGGGGRRFEPSIGEGEGEAPVVDLDADIEDADRSTEDEEEEGSERSERSEMSAMSEGESRNVERSPSIIV
ncbi:hypothetical protein JCM3765_000715 [Sporobolomyces pararoseus]